MRYILYYVDNRTGRRWYVTAVYTQEENSDWTCDGGESFHEGHTHDKCRADIWFHRHANSATWGQVCEKVP